MKKFVQKVLSSVLTAAMLLTMTGTVLAADTADSLTVNDIDSIQAYTDMTFYGQGLVEVEITYKDGVDLSDIQLTPDSYILEDRGTQTPDYGEVAISDVSVDGQTVTLTTANGTAATDSNVLLYTGDDAEGSRSRNAFGIYCTGAWYRGADGNIYYGSEDTDDYKANTTGMGYQARESLELKLRHADEDAADAVCLANADGSYNANGLWKETIDRNFGDGGFLTFEEAGIQIESTAKDAKDVVPDEYVRGYIYVPEDYTGNEAVPVVFTITGNGTSFWILEDGTNNFGTNIMYDAATTSWMGKGAIVVGIHDRSNVGGGGEDYDYLVDDVNVMKYVLENYNIDRNRIIIHGNSRSTMAASTIIQALAGQPYSSGQDNADWGTRARTKTLDKSVYDFTISVFLCNNGLYGGQELWSYEDRLAIAKTGLRAWIFDAEQDFNNIDYVDEQIKAFKEVGYSDEWIAENLRLTCFPSELFYYWGESDHSTTRINYWYFGNGEIYYGADCHVENGELVYDSKVQPGGTYTVQARGASRSGTKEGHQYTVYGENFQEWALSSQDAPASSASPASEDIVSIQATTIPSFYGYKVGTVEITYKSGTDMSGVSLNDYTLYDRGFQNPEFGEVRLSAISVKDNVVTLRVDEGSDKTGDRTRETYGTLCTSSNWYIDSEGAIHYGTEESTDALGNTIYPNTIGKGLQLRNLDLVLCVNDDDISSGIASTNGVGEMLENTVWKETILSGDLDDVRLEMVNVGWEAADYTMLGDKGEVPVQVIYPEGYDANRAEPYPVILYQCGGGVCYWEVTDGETTAANNLGCNVVYDTMMTEWHRQMPNAIIMSVNVHSSTVENSATEIAGVLDYSIANWNVDKDRILVVGNSQGTLICSDLIRQRSDLVAGYLECNGNLGAMTAADQLDGTLANSSLGGWTEEEVQAMIDNEVSVWMFNGETDGDNPAAQQDVIEIVKDLYRQAGKSEDWISANVRASGLQSWKFKDWGETDHSVTKVVAWFYLDQPYTDVWEGKEALKAGDTYTYTGLEEGYDNYQYTKDYKYTVYAESVAQWAQIVFGDASAVEPSTPEGFTDVPSGKYYYDAVQWAVEKGVTTGYDDGTFRPDNSCTRAQMVTFLWRYAGEPEPESSTNPFSDISSDKYYYKAVLWAVEQGITNGTTDTTFDPNKTVTRAQTVTFLYRYADEPEVTGSDSFSDVESGKYFTNAIQWAVGDEITTGYADGTFQPYNNCTRAQIVTFMYRDFAE